MIRSYYPVRGDARILLILPCVVCLIIADGCGVQARVQLVD